MRRLLIFEVVETLGEGEPFPSEIGVDATDLAISWCEFLEKHACKSYGEYLEPKVVAGRRLFNAM